MSSLPRDPFAELEAQCVAEYTRLFEEHPELLDEVANDPAPGPAAVLRCLAGIAPEPLRWLWPERIPLGKPTLVTGDPGLGKSLLAAAEITACVTRRGVFPDGAACETGEVILLSAEDDPADTIRPRLDAAGADVSRVHMLQAVRAPLGDGAVTEHGFSLESDVAILEQTLEQHPGVRLVVIDPISAYLGTADGHSTSEVRALLAPLAAMAARTGVAVVGITHLRKSAGAAIHRSIASIEFVAAARAVWAVVPDPADPERRLLLPVKQNLAANRGGLAFRIEAAPHAELPGIPRLVWEPGPVEMDVNDVLADPGGPYGTDESRSAGREAQQWLAALLAESPVPVKRIQAEARAAGLPWITVRRAKTALGVRARKGGVCGGWTWEGNSPQAAPSCPEDAQPRV